MGVQSPPLDDAAGVIDLLDFSSEALFVLDAQGRVLGGNAAWHAGPEVPDLDRLLALADDAAAALAVRDAWARQACVDGLHVRWATPAGEVRRGELHLAPGRSGRWLGRLVDVTARLAAEARARELSGRLDFVQDIGRLGVWERDIRTGAGTWDPHVFRFFGLEPAPTAPSVEEASARLHPDDLEALRAAWEASLTRAGRYEGHYRVPQPSGRVTMLHSLWEVRNGPSGQPEHVIGMMVDDTDTYELALKTRLVSEQFELAMELANLVIWRHDLATDVTHFNRQGALLLGLDVQDLPIEAIREFIHPDDRQAMAEAVAQAIAERRPVDVIARYRQPGGRWCTLLTRRVVQYGPDGEPAGVIGVGLDITERLAERSQTQALTSRIELMVESAGVGLWSVEPATGRVEWNRRMFEMYGLPEGPAPSLKQWMQQLIHPDDRDRLRQERQRAQTSGRSVFETEFRILRPDGTVRWVLCSSRREEAATHTMVFGLHLDLTERRQTEEALSQARERILLATRGAGIAAWDRDLVTGVSYWDPQMYRLRGLSPDDPRSIQELASCVHPDDRRQLMAMYEAALSDPACDSTNFEFRVVWPDGSEHWLATRSAILRNEVGTAVRIIGLNWDVTERRQAEQDRRAKEAAEQASRAKSAFLARMSHELRTPLNAVLGFTQVLQADSPRALTPGQREKLDHIHTAGRHLLALIDDVLDLARIESGALQLECGPLALADVVADALQLMGPMARKHGVTMSPSGVSGRVLADPRRLRQVLMNLLSNAIKYNRPSGQVEVRAQPGGGEWALVVCDTGRGMTASQLAGLFEPFNRLGAEREGIEGTGIGLSIAQQLTQHMGGRLEVSSRPGQGSEFRLWLPAAPDDQPVLPRELRPAPPALAGGGEGRSLRMLYIEDNEVNVLLVQELVALRPQIELDCAADGFSGVACAIQRRHDLVLIDMHLPDIDGHEVLRRLRARPELAGAKCIALSANAMPEDVDRALSAGFDDYWTKPVDVQRFLSALDALMAQQRRPGRTVDAA